MLRQLVIKRLSWEELVHFTKVRIAELQLAQEIPTENPDPTDDGQTEGSDSPEMTQIQPLHVQETTSSTQDINFMDESGSNGQQCLGVVRHGQGRQTDGVLAGMIWDKLKEINHFLRIR